MKLLTDTWLLYLRSLRGTLRNPIWIIIGLFQPIIFLLLFAPLLTGMTALPGFPHGGVFNMFAPGLLVMIALYGTAFAGFGLVEQIRTGVLERLLVSPASRLAILLGFVLRDVTVQIVQSVILVVIAIPMGLSANLLGLLATFGLLVLIAGVLASASYALALLYKDEGNLASTLNIIMTPLMLLSGIMLPLSFAPAAIRAIADVNPFAYDVAAARAMFIGSFGDQSILIAFLLMGALTVVAFSWAARSFKRGAL